MPVLDLNANYVANDPHLGDVKAFFTDKFGVGNISTYSNYGVTANAEGLYFDGNSYLRFNGNFSYSDQDSFTFEFWAKWSEDDFMSHLNWGIPVQWGYRGLDNEWYFDREYFFLFSSNSIVKLNFSEYWATETLHVNQLYDEWHHVALVREHNPSGGHFLKCFLDGVQFDIDGDFNVNSANNTAFPEPNTANATPDYAIWVGKMQSFNTFSFKGTMKDFRFTKGVARYKGNFTPTNYFSKKAFDKLYYGATEVQKFYKGSELLYSSPPPPNGLLLLLDSDFSDSSGNNIVVNSTGNIVTTDSKYGTGCFNSGILYNIIPQLTLNAPFTVEFWGKVQQGLTSYEKYFFKINSVNNRYTSLTNYFNILRFLSDDIIDYNPPNTWQHYAMTFDGVSEKLYIGGNLMATRSIGISQLNNPNFAYTGLLDSIRISPFIRYTANFNPETDTGLAY